jgi:hypothetical protein
MTLRPTMVTMLLAGSALLATSSASALTNYYMRTASFAAGRSDDNSDSCFIDSWGNAYNNCSATHTWVVPMTMVLYTASGDTGIVTGLGNGSTDYCFLAGIPYSSTNGSGVYYSATQTLGNDSGSGQSGQSYLSWALPSPGYTYAMEAICSLAQYSEMGPVSITQSR